MPLPSTDSLTNYLIAPLLQCSTVSLPHCGSAVVSWPIALLLYWLKVAVPSCDISFHPCCHLVWLLYCLISHCSSISQHNYSAATLLYCLTAPLLYCWVLPHCFTARYCPIAPMPSGPAVPLAHILKCLTPAALLPYCLTLSSALQFAPLPPAWLHQCPTASLPHYLTAPLPHCPSTSLSHCLTVPLHLCWTASPPSTSWPNWAPTPNYPLRPGLLPHGVTLSTASLSHCLQSRCLNALLHHYPNAILNNYRSPK